MSFTMSEGKKHVSIVICGHVDAGKSTTTGRLIFELGGISEREMTKLKDEAKALGKDSFAFAFYMDKSKEERARGVTIACTTKGSLHCLTLPVDSALPSAAVLDGMFSPDCVI